MKFSMTDSELRIENETGGFIMRWDWYERSFYWFNLQNQYDTWNYINWLNLTEFTQAELSLFKYFSSEFNAKFRDWWKSEIYN